MWALTIGTTIYIYIQRPKRPQALQARYPALRMVLQEKLTTTGQILLLRMVRESSPLIFVVVEGGQKLTHIIIHLRAQKNEQAVPDGPPKLVLLGNTHLFYHPKAQHIRLMQARDGSTTSAFVHTSKPLAHSH